MQLHGIVVPRREPTVVSEGPQFGKNGSPPCVRNNNCLEVGAPQPSLANGLQITAVCLNQPANSLPLIEKLSALENFLFFSIDIDLDETGKANLGQKQVQAHDAFGHRGAKTVTEQLQAVCIFQ